jgi:3-methylcrotonyl-CoA carboxylase alpha subunit
VQARAKLLRGLRQTFIAGVKTNRDFLIALLEHQDFASGSFDTGLIARELAQLTHLDAPSSRDWAVAAIFALGLPRENIGVAYQGFSNFSSLQHSVLLRWQDKENLVQVSISGHSAAVRVESEILELKANTQGWFLEGSDGVAGFKDGKHIYVYGTSTYVFEAPNPLDRSSTVKSDGAILAPMPGLVKAVFVEQGQQVVQGDAILVLEAMKMQHTLRAGEGGSVKELSVEADDQVKAGQVLALIKSDEVSI